MNATWDFDYRPLRNGTLDDGCPASDLVLATNKDVDPAHIIEALAPLGDHVEATPLISTHPIFWTRIRAQSKIDRSWLTDALEHMGVGVRYVTSACAGSQMLAPALDFSEARPRRPSDWRARSQRHHAERDTLGRWFLGPRGVDVRREICGTGAGTRLAVIDNDAGSVEALALDGEFRIGDSQPNRASYHAARLIGWAVGTSCGSFTGVAPDASPRLYLIPNAGDDVFTLPVAIVRAVDDGADVVLCATYLEGQNGPLLDDALEVAVHLGRRGRGTIVTFPTSRELSSPPGSVHASLSLGLGEPASDPRVLCIAPSGSNGAWFLWRDRQGKLRPFANRGPALRFMAPGDDLADPIASPLGEQSGERLTHSESSGASAIAAGAALLVLGGNPDLTASELTDILEQSTISDFPEVPESQIGDLHDVLPAERDADGHDAKHGYGRLSAGRACLVALDPVTATWIAIGEEALAMRWLARISEATAEGRAYTRELGTWAARALIADNELRHRAKLLARYLRLVAGRRNREMAQLPGAFIRMLALCVRALQSSRRAPEQPPSVARELALLASRLNSMMSNSEASQTWEAAAYELVARVSHAPGDRELESRPRARIAS